MHVVSILAVPINPISISFQSKDVKGAQKSELRFWDLRIIESHKGTNSDLIPTKNQFEALYFFNSTSFCHVFFYFVKVNQFTK